MKIIYFLINSITDFFVEESMLRNDIKIKIQLIILILETKEFDTQLALRQFFLEVKSLHYIV